MKKIVFILSFLVSTISFQQDITPIFEDTVFDNSTLKISSFNYYSSNRFSNDLLDKFLFGGEITTPIKGASSQRLKDVNTIGAQFEQEIEYMNGNIHPIRNPKYGLKIGISDNHFLNTNIEADLFNLALYGNAPFVDEVLDFSGTHFQYLHYQKVGIGVFEKRTQSSFQFNFIAGSRGIDGSLTESSLITQNDSISLMLQGTGFRTNEFSPYIGLQGYGFSVDINYNFLFANKKGDLQVINLQIENLGIIGWNRTSFTYAVDSLTHYDGFNATDFLNRPEGSTDDFNFIDTLGLIETQTTAVGTLPIQFSIQKVALKNSSQKFQFIGGIKTVLALDYFPYFYGGAYYKASDNFNASSRISYGGFAGLQWGINLNYWLQEKVSFSLGSANIIGYLSKKNGFGRSLNFSANFNL